MLFSANRRLYLYMPLALYKQYILQILDYWKSQSNSVLLFIFPVGSIFKQLSSIWNKLAFGSSSFLQKDKEKGQLKVEEISAQALIWFQLNIWIIWDLTPDSTWLFSSATLFLTYWNTAVKIGETIPSLFPYNIVAYFFFLLAVYILLKFIELCVMDYSLFCPIFWHIPGLLSPSGVYMYNKCPLLCISFFRSFCPGNFPLSNNCSALLFFVYFFFISSILACFQVVYSSKYCCRHSIRLFDWICCGIYHPASISILQVHCYPYRNRYRFCVLKISFISIYHSFIQYQCRSLFFCRKYWKHTSGPHCSIMSGSF